MPGPSPPFSNGVPELLVLHALAGAEMHGYDLVREIQRRTDDEIIVSEGVLYPLLHRLTDAGLLLRRERKIAGRRRICYRLSRAGHRHCDGLTKEWRRMNSAVEHAIAAD